MMGGSLVHLFIKLNPKYLFDQNPVTCWSAGHPKATIKRTNSVWNSGLYVGECSGLMYIYV